MKDTDRQLLVDLRRALLHLHKTLLDWERAAYERIHGRTSPGSLLTALMNDAQFAWLRPLSELIVRIDESLEMDALEGPEIDVDAMVSLAAAAITADETGTAAAQRHHKAMQEYPDAVFAHRAVTNVLKSRQQGGTRA
jgi:hypothetical protein